MTGLFPLTTREQIQLFVMFELAAPLQQTLNTLVVKGEERGV